MGTNSNPDPGSEDAIELGCSCPVIDNHHGNGVPSGPDGKERWWWFSGDCPIHGDGSESA